MAGIATTAVSSRVFSTGAPARSSAPLPPPRSVRDPESLALDLRGDAAEASLPLLEEGERLEVLALAELRPHALADVDLGVGELPQEEVADAHLAAGADEQVRVGDAGGAQVLRDGAGGDAPRVELAALDAPGDGTS